MENEDFKARFNRDVDEYIKKIKEKKHLHNHMKMSLLFYFLNIKFINLKSVHVTPAVNLLLHSDLHVLLHKQFLLLPLSLLQCAI